MMIKKILFSLAILMLITTALSAQQKYFVYIQCETKDPFYVQVNGATYSSTPSGYLIIPKLTTDNYAVTIGFAKNKYPEQNFNLTVNNDMGYSLKQFGDKGWGLFDLETFATVMPGDAFASSKTAAAEIKKTADTQPEVVAAPVNTAVIAAQDPVSASTTKGIIKSSEKSTGKNLEQIYIDNTGDKPDTIKIQIPITAKKVSKPQPQAEQAQPQFIEQAPVQPVPVQAKEQETAVTTAPPVVQTSVNCIIAADDDFLKVRLQMAGSPSESEMLKAAANAFKDKCFSTEQIKNLSYLFLQEQNKFNFFVMAKPVVYDKKNFGSLKSQLTSPDLISQFKSLSR